MYKHTVGCEGEWLQHLTHSGCLVSDAVSNPSPCPSIGLESFISPGRHIHTGFRCCLRVLLDTALLADTPIIQNQGKVNPFSCSWCRRITRLPTSLNNQDSCLGTVQGIRPGQTSGFSQSLEASVNPSPTCREWFVGHGAEKQAQGTVWWGKLLPTAHPSYQKSHPERWSHQIKEKNNPSIPLKWVFIWFGVMRAIMVILLQ